MPVAAVMTNLSRVLIWWRVADWRACFAYAITGIPAAALGAHTLLTLPAHWTEIALDVFFISMIPFRHWLIDRNLRLRLW